MFSSIELSNQYFIGQKVLFLNKDETLFKSKVCQACIGKGKVLLSDSSTLIECPFCIGYGFVIDNDCQDRDILDSEVLPTVGEISGIKIFDSGKIHYKINADLDFHKKLIGSNPSEILRYFDISGNSKSREGFFHVVVEEEDILSVWDDYNSIKNSKDILEYYLKSGDDIFYPTKSTYWIEEKCPLCNGSNKVILQNGETVKCPKLYNAYHLKEKVIKNQILYGKITDVFVEISEIEDSNLKTILKCYANLNRVSYEEQTEKYSLDQVNKMTIDLKDHHLTKSFDRAELIASQL